jgi:hypothetical protein
VTSNHMALSRKRDRTRFSCTLAKMTRQQQRLATKKTRYSKKPTRFHVENDPGTPDSPLTAEQPPAKGKKVRWKGTESEESEQEEEEEEIIPDKVCR